MQAFTKWKCSTGNWIQASLEISIAHQLILSLRQGSLPLVFSPFSKVVGVGHSLGSELTYSLTSKHPNDLDAAVLTGFSASTAGQSTFFAVLDLVIARENAPLRFLELNNGYLVSQPIVSNQFRFFRARTSIPLSSLRLKLQNRRLPLGSCLRIVCLWPRRRSSKGWWMSWMERMICRFVRVIVWCRRIGRWRCVRCCSLMSRTRVRVLWRREPGMR